MRKYPFLILIGLIYIGIVVVVALPALAHPGRTASDGCHYCRTRCDYWGVPWNQRHCHGGGIVPPTPPPPLLTPPTPVPAPTPQPVDYTIQQELTAPVVAIIDGDTIKVKLPDEKIETVRFIGIDTPETKDPRKPVQCFGAEATEHLKGLIEGKSVTLIRDALDDNRDKYQRLLRYIMLGSDDINLRMIQDGYAYAYTSFPFSRKDTYVAMQKVAREMELGLWASDTCNGERELTPPQPETVTPTITAPVIEAQQTSFKAHIIAIIKGLLEKLFGWKK